MEGHRFQMEFGPLILIGQYGQRFWSVNGIDPRVQAQKPNFTHLLAFSQEGCSLVDIKIRSSHSNSSSSRLDFHLFSTENHRLTRLGSEHCLSIPQVLQKSFLIRCCTDWIKVNRRRGVDNR